MQPLTLEIADQFAERFFAERAHVSTASRDYSRDEILAYLRENIAAMQAEVEGMTPEQLAYRLPGADEGPDASGDETHFDTAEIVTHMASGTAFHWWNITRALRHERPPMPKPPEGTPVTGKNRSGVGAGGWRGLSGPELSAHLGTTLDAFYSYIEELPDEAFSAGTSSFGLFRDMTPHDWLFLVGIHSAMHLNQIRMMKAQPDYPG
jgi:DinB superfamily